LNGASPASAAICLRLSIPSSGGCASRVREHLADSGHGTQQFAGLAPQGIVANQLREFIVEAGEALLQPTDVFIDAEV
jgi:hypothetical protein